MDAGITRRIVVAMVAWAAACAPESEPGSVDDAAATSGPLIYGADDRREYYALGASDAALAASTVGVFDRSKVVQRRDGTYAIDTSITYASYWSLCASEPYRDQPTSAFCSGVQVGPDLVATAGHCVSASNCGSTAFVFGFRMDDADTVRADVPANDVYFCASVVARAESSTNDFAIVRVDRPIVGHSPVRVRRSGSVAVGDPLVVAGHPAGIPLKVAGGATVRGNSHADYFESNLDTYGGNSGSPVVNGATRELEGLLVRGNGDYDWVSASRCYVSNECADSGCPGWEEVTRVSKFLAYIPEGCTSDAACDDGQPCNGAERCSAGRCVAGTPVDCSDAAGRCTDDRCVAIDATRWECSHTPVSCEDGNACTVGSCDPIAGCSHAPVACDGGSDGCCSPGCEGIDADCEVPACAVAGARCSANADCCSGRCNTRRQRCK